MEGEKRNVKTIQDKKINFCRRIFLQMTIILIIIFYNGLQFAFGLIFFVVFNCKMMVPTIVAIIAWMVTADDNDDENGVDNSSCHNNHDNNQ